MFPYPIATPQGCNIQTFYGSGELITPSEGVQYSWNKPIGVSHVYMMLIGGGGNGDGTTGGGSGAVTVWYGAAQHVPNSLVIEVAGSGGGQNTIVAFRNGSAQHAILLAATANGSLGGAASPARPFTTSGFFKSTAGQAGSASAITASSTTFLSGGGASTSAIRANYGYILEASTSGLKGIFQTQPIIVGLGSRGTGNGAVGCGGGLSSGVGGPGMVLIASW
jgi:hypothetical protein